MYVFRCPGLYFQLHLGKTLKRYDSLIEMTNKLNDQDVTIFLMSDDILCAFHRSSKNYWIPPRNSMHGASSKISGSRGAITRGSVTQYKERVVTEPNRFIIPFLGDGYLRAYTLEVTLNISGVLDSIFFRNRRIKSGFKGGLTILSMKSICQGRV